MKEKLARYQARIEQVLDRCLTLPDSGTARLREGMRYSVLGGGKRLRPVLVYTTGEALGASLEQLDIPAAAVELVHVYSLVHDDLPAMDDDDLRRGRPTCHRAFDEATAILVGDALQALAGSSRPGGPVQLAYVNPETGGPCLNTLAFAALFLRPGEEVVLPRDSAARMFHVVEGNGEAQVNETAIAFEHADTFCAPGLATVRLANRSSLAPLYLVSADESPLQRKLGVYEQR